jgi:GNAT superfamily N-acetyltransferase
MMWIECSEDGTRFEDEDLTSLVDDFVDHVRVSHDWPYPESAIRNYAQNFAEATVRLTGSTERLPEIGVVSIHPVTEDRVDDWIRFFDHDAFAGNPDWASCYCLEPHRADADEVYEGPWREIKAEMIDRLRDGSTYGYLAYVDGETAGWVNASPRSEYCKYRDVDPDGPDPSTVIGISCFIIAPPYRRHGLAARLLDRVLTDAGDRGARWVEGYPVSEPRGDDASHFRGPTHLYAERGFEPVERRERDTVVRRAVT